MNKDRKFAGFTSHLKEASYTIVGVPFDKTSSFRTGTRDGPYKIRDASYCFEPYLMEYGISLSQLPLCDLGNMSYDDFKELQEKIHEVTGNVLDEESFPIFLGGEHSISVPVVSSVRERYSDLTVLILDAHLDFRDSYEGLKHSHATVSRRISEIAGLENVIVGGVRSFSSGSADIEKPTYYSSKQIKTSTEFLDLIDEDVDHPVYLSIDMDVIDPSSAPGVGNPEPFGLAPTEIKKIISNISTSLVGMDIVEVNPKYDESDITSNLAARLVYELIGNREKKK